MIRQTLDFLHSKQKTTQSTQIKVSDIRRTIKILAEQQNDRPPSKTDCQSSFRQIDTYKVHLADINYYPFEAKKMSLILIINYRDAKKRACVRPA